MSDVSRIDQWRDAVLFCDLQNAEKILGLMDEEEEHLVQDITELNSQQEQAKLVRMIYVVIVIRLW